MSYTDDPLTIAAQVPTAPAEVPDTASPPPEPIDLHTAHQEAEWRLRLLRKHRAAIARVEQDAHAQLVEIETWRDSEVRRYQSEINRLELEARPYASALIKADPLKRKSVSLPSGRIGYREGRERVVIEDAEAAMVWLAEWGQDDLVRVKREVDLPAVKALFHSKSGHLVTGEGEIIPGLRVETGETAWYAETGRDAE